MKLILTIYCILKLIKLHSDRPVQFWEWLSILERKRDQDEVHFRFLDSLIIVLCLVFCGMVYCEYNCKCVAYEHCLVAKFLVAFFCASMERKTNQFS